MGLPVSPSSIKALIPKPGGSFCEKFLNLVNNLPLFVYQIVAYIWTEAGTFTDDFKADVCNISCKCGGGVIPGGGLRAPLVSASDGQFSDRVQIIWDLIPGATAYDVYRNTLDSPNSANTIATDLTSPVYEDATVNPGQFYYYWVKARSPTSASPFSNSDRGHAGSIATSLAAVTDLAASQGFWASPGLISLVWTPVAGAESYDIYRNSNDDFTTATLIDSNRIPFDNSGSTSTGPTPTFVDNGGELVYLHDPGEPNYRNSYYFWVIAKRSGPPAQSPQSNSARGWVVGLGGGQLYQLVGTLGGHTQSQATHTIPAGIARIWAALHGAGAGGAGGGAAHGGGGGGGGAMVTGWFNVVAGAKIRILNTPDTITSNANAETNGSNGSVTKLQYSANGNFTDTVDLLVCNAADGGDYNPAGYGAGGTGATGSKHASVQEGAIHNGRDGKAADGATGGRSGQRFGNFRWPGGGLDGFSRGAGSGSHAKPSTPTLAKGGRGHLGFAVFVQYTS